MLHGRIRLGNFVKHFVSVEHISYSTGTSRNSVEHKRCQEKCIVISFVREVNHVIMAATLDSRQIPADTTSNFAN